MAKKKVINRTHKNPSSDGINLNAEVGGDLLGMKGGKENPSLTAWEDYDETDPEDIGGSMATIEATLNYINKVLNEGDESSDGEEDPELDSDDLNDAEMDMADAEDDEDDEDDVEFDDNGDTGFGDGEEADSDMEECGEDDENFEGYDADGELGDEDDDEEDDEEFGGEEDDEDGDEDFEDDDDEGDDFIESFLWEGDDMPNTEVIGTEPDSDLPDEEDASAGISVDIPDDIDPNDVSVKIGDSNYVPDIDSAEDVGDEDDEEEDMGDEDEFDGDDVVEDEDEDVPVSESSIYGPYHRGVFEEDDPTIDDVTGEDEEDDELSGIDDDDDEPEKDEEPESDDGEISESAVLKILRRLIREDQRSDDPITSDPSCNTGDSPVDTECDIDDSEAEEDDLSGDEGDVDDADIPIEKGTIQPEEASELKWMARRLKKIMEGDEDSHKEDGKTSAEPLDDEAEDILGDISDSLEDDGSLTDVGNGAVEDGETTLGSVKDEEPITDNDDIAFTSSNGDSIEDDEAEDEDTHLTDNYHMVMNMIEEAFAKKKTNKKKAAGKKKVQLKKVAKAKKAGKKKVKESDEGLAGDFKGAAADQLKGQFNKGKSVNDSATDVAARGADEIEFKEGKNLENTVLGNFNRSEMTSVLKSLNNAFGTGSTSIAKEIRDSHVVSEVSVPTKALPIAENATWDGVNAGKLLVETAYKSESKVNTNLLKLTHLYWINEGADPSDYKFPIASMVEGKAQIIPEAIDEATKLFASPSFILRFSETALKKIRNVLDFYNEKMGKVSPWKSNDQIQVSEAAKITMIDRTSYNPYAVLKRLSEQENAKKLINLRG